MTHRFFFKAESGEVVRFDVKPDMIAGWNASGRAEFLWHLDRYLNQQTPELKPEHLCIYQAWTTQVLACAVSKVKRRLYVKAKK